MTGPTQPAPLLFTPLKLASLTLPNRVVVSPMCMYSASQGLANDFHLVHLGQFALSGTGLILAEATAASPEGRISPEDLGLWEDAQIAPLARITDFVHAYNGLIGVQLAHAGRKASTFAPGRGKGAVPAERGGWPVIGPDGQAFHELYPVPTAMTLEDIARVTADFGAAARRADLANFDVIELHAAHGYLLHQFLSPLSNSRTDEYGGSFENRARFLLEVVRKVRESWPVHKPLLVRLSATDWVPGGWDEAQTLALAKLLQFEGVDALDLSSGGLSREQQIPVGPAYQVPFAAQIKRELPDLKVMTVGLIETPQRAEGVLQSGEADLIALGRPLLGDPHWVWAAAQALGVAPSVAEAYARGTRISF
ncbi:NADH:flavin oxidoreductase/NADH oxidase [Deinococcus taklimakanensis]|uniref:NADH:flavin oxidoreductase/NADH oxidase n=1 Tax=Deinococcus taklimakanensis TaxID=536443 RepID=A0ABW5P1X1_9DEIO